MMSRLWVLLPVLALLGFWLLGAHNRLIRLRGAVSGTYFALDVQLRKRQTLTRQLCELLLGSGSDDGDAARAAVPGLSPALVDPLHAHVEAAERAAQQAQAAIERLQRRVLTAALFEPVQQAEAAMDRAVAGLSEALQQAALESPLASEPSALLDRLQRVRNPISFSVDVYNRAAQAYNQALDVFPTRVAATLFQFHPAVTLTLQRAALPESTGLAPPVTE